MLSTGSPEKHSSPEAVSLLEFKALTRKRLLHRFPFCTDLCRLGLWALVCCPGAPSKLSDSVLDP